MNYEEELEQAVRGALEKGDTLDNAMDRAQHGTQILIEMGGPLALSFVGQVEPMLTRIRAKLEKELA